MTSRLSPLQRRVIALLAGMDWTLTGGAALAGYHLGHRTTRDLDFFWRDRLSLDHLPDDVTSRLMEAGLTVDRQTRARTFCRLLVQDGTESLPIDLVVDLAAPLDEPVEVEPGVRVDTRREILVNKLTAMLGRWAARDLVDVRALLDAGESLDEALADAPRKDGGFSPETLAWVLDTTLPARALPDDLRSFKEQLVRRLLAP